MSTEERLSRLEGAFVILTELARNMDERMDNFNERMDERMNNFDEKLSALGEAQRRTEENLNILINTVERFISEGRNGKS